MDKGLLRQRRNLILTGIALWLLCYGKVKIASMSALGFRVDNFENPNIVPIGLWVMFVYFFIRYYQYFTEHGIPALRKRLQILLAETCNPIIEKTVKKEEPLVNEACLFEYSALKINNWYYLGQRLDSSNNEADSSADNNIRMKIGKIILLPSIAVSYFKLVTTSTAFTDYLFPFALAIFVFIYCGFSNWQGNIFNLIVSAFG